MEKCKGNGAKKKSEKRSKTFFRQQSTRLHSIPRRGRIRISFPNQGFPSFREGIELPFRSKIPHPPSISLFFPANKKRNSSDGSLEVFCQLFSLFPSRRLKRNVIEGPSNEKAHWSPFSNHSAGNVRPSQSGILEQKTLSSNSSVRSVPVCALSVWTCLL